MISCDDAMARLYEYLDGELVNADADEVEAHFRICGECRPRLLFEQSFLDAIERARSGEAVPDSLRSRVRDMLKSENSDTQ